MVKQRDYEGSNRDGNNSAPRGNASESNANHSRLLAEHNAKDEFVKRQQEMTAKMAGRDPRLEPKDMLMNATMVNNGEHAKEFGRELTRGLDKTAFPVK